MSLATLVRILEQMADYNAGETVISWTGGEPLLMGRAFFELVLATQRRLGKKFTNILQTNAILLDKNWIEFLLANNFQVRTSLDFPPELHDEMRQAGNFSATLEKIKLMVATGLPVNVNTVITNRNIDKVEEIYAFLKQLAISSFSVSRMVLQGNALINHDLAIRENSEFGLFLVKLFDLWINDRNEPRIARITPLDKLLNACQSYLRHDDKDPCFHCQDQLLAIGPGGEVYPSCNKFFGVPESCLGNITDRNLAEVLKSPERGKFLSEVSAVTERLCSECEFMPICEGGCFYIAYNIRHEAEQITGREQFCKGYYLILARIMDYLREGK
jgi:uncharacterized protein